MDGKIHHVHVISKKIKNIFAQGQKYYRWQ